MQICTTGIQISSQGTNLVVRISPSSKPNPD
jgi:hypothetical protein